MSNLPNGPTSLFNAKGQTAADRKALKSVKVANGAPNSNTPGLSTRCKQFVHVIVSLPDAGTSLEWRLWIWDGASESWCVLTSIGTSGIVALGAAYSPQRTVVDVCGSPYVYLELLTFAGTFTQGADVWLSSVGDMNKTP